MLYLCVCIICMCIIYVCIYELMVCMYVCMYGMYGMYVCMYVRNTNCSIVTLKFVPNSSQRSFRSIFSETPER